MAKKEEAPRRAAELPDGGEVPAENEYYRRISGRYRVWKYVFLLLLVVYLVVMLLSYGDSITYANLKFLLKDINTSSESAPGDFSSVYFDKQQDMNFALFRGSLAVSGDSRLTVYTPGSPGGIEYLLNASSPVVLTSDRYLLFYDLGSKQYGLYTALANVYSGTAEHEITGGALSRGGAFALITRSSKAKYQLTLWDASLRRVGTYYPADTDDYIFDAAISDDASRIVLVTASVDMSAFSTRVLLAEAGATSYRADITLPGEMPLSAMFFSDGHFCIVCDKNAYFFDENGERLAAFPTTGLNLSSVSPSGILFVTSENVVESENAVSVLDSSGKSVREAHVSARLRDAALAGDGTVYLLGTDRVFRIAPNASVSEELCSGSVLRLLAGDGYVLLCRPTGVSTAFADGKE